MFYILRRSAYRLHGRKRYEEENIMENNNNTNTNPRRIKNENEQNDEIYEVDLMEDDGEEYIWNKPKKNKHRKRRNKGGFIGPFLLGLICVAAISAAIFLYIKYDEALQKSIESDKRSAELEAKLETALVPEKVEQMTTEAKESGKAEVMDQIKGSLSGGEKGPLDTIRDLFPESILLAYRGNYIFTDINRELPQNNYNNTDFSLGESKRLSYVGSDTGLTTEFGIDVSSFQGDIDWKAVAADGVKFAFIRAGYRGWGEKATFNADEKFVQNIEGAAENGISVGVYWVTHAVDKADVDAELNFLYEIIDPYKDKITYPLVYDLEQPETEENRIWNLSREQMTENAVHFLNSAKEKGYTPMFYGNLTTFTLLVDTAQILNYPCWFAWYSVPLYYPYDFNIWQYGFAKVNGIKGEVDVNILMKKVW